MSSEEATAAGEGKKNNNITPRASPTKTDAAATATADNLPNFTEKEERVLKIVSPLRLSKSITSRLLAGIP